MNLYETVRQWNPFLQTWLCNYCGAIPEIKYVSTGHDHTDRKYHLCSCYGAERYGKPDEELN